MIWPSGPAKGVKGLAVFGSHVHEPLVTFAISKNNFYALLCTEHHLGLYRLKPFCPTYIHTDTTANYSKVAISHTGAYLSVQSGAKIHVFKVSVDQSHNEVLKPRSQLNKSPGPGESLGVRELSMRRVAVLESPHPIVNICAFQDYFVVVSPEHMQFSSWSNPLLEPVHTGSIFDDLQVESASHSVLLSRLCLLCDSDQLFLVHIKRDQFKALPLPEQPEPAIATCFNLRFAKVVVVYPTKILLYNVKDIDESPISVDLEGLGAIRSLEWSSSGLVLAVGHSRGWSLISVLGMPLYESTTPTLKCEWGIGNDELFVLTETGRLHIYETMHVLNSASTSSFKYPILHSGNRIQIYADGTKTSIPSNAWVTVPLPNIYLATSWPLTTSATSSNGKYVALAGFYGLIYMSVVERQWKIFSERDIMVKTGGVLWYKTSLVLALVPENGKSKIQIFSTALRGNTVHDEEEQMTANLDFSSPVVSMSIQEENDELTVLLHNGDLLQYSLVNPAPVQTYKAKLLDVFCAPGRIRLLHVLDADRTLFLLDDRLVMVTKRGNGFVRKTVSAPVEFFYVENDNVWVFDGENMTIIELATLDRFSFDLEAYPVGINLRKGLVVTVSAALRTSYDRYFDYVEPTTDFQVFLPSLFELPSKMQQLAKTYYRLDYFDDIMESTLYHRLVESPEHLQELAQVIKMYCNWQRVAARCARKTETKYWDRLFEAFNEQPESLFRAALDSNNLETAAEYLMILQAQFKADPGDSNMLRLYNQAIDAGDFDICKQLSEFMLAVDGTGNLLKTFVDDLQIVAP